MSQPGRLHPSAAVRGPYSASATSRTLQLSYAVSAHIPRHLSTAPRLDPWAQPHSAECHWLSIHPVTELWLRLPSFPSCLKAAQGVPEELGCPYHDHACALLYWKPQVQNPSLPRTIALSPEYRASHLEADR